MPIDEKALEAAARAYCLSIDVDPDIPHAMASGAPLWWTVEAPHIRAAILAYESAKPKEAEGWQDIASARQDWSDLVLYDPERERSVFEGYYSCADGGDDCWKDASGEACEPTMWRPLPEPPSAMLSAAGETR